MADLITDTFRKYQEDGSSKSPGPSITITKSKTDYSVDMGFEHPDTPINNEYIAAGAALDHWRPLCSGVHNGIICKRPVTWRKGSRYCGKGKGDENS